MFLMYAGHKFVRISAIKFRKLRFYYVTWPMNICHCVAVTNVSPIKFICSKFYNNNNDDNNNNLYVRVFNSCRRLPETKRHSSLFLY